MADIQTDIHAVVNGEHPDPFAFLGMHPEESSGLCVRAFLPGAESVTVIDAHTHRTLGQLACLHPDGLFSARVSGSAPPFPYRLKVRFGGKEHELDDPFRFGPVLGELDRHLLAEGRHQRAYEKLGANYMTHEGVEGVAFAVWAPNAQRVSLVGVFNAWDGRRHPMRRHEGAGFWEIFIPGLPEGAAYKYEIIGDRGQRLPLKSDPFARFCEHSPATASLTWDPRRYKWGDSQWMDARASAAGRDAPISIYEVHLGSWRRVQDEGSRYLNYREQAAELIPYVVDMGFTHVELLPVSEHPFDGSWGYQPIGLFAPTSRFGTPDDFCYFVDQCHQHGLGVIIDWVPAHFPEDAHGLVRFDGTALYEHEDPRQGRHHGWGTLIYNFGRREVANFLISNAVFWAEQYHIDGLRVDAVASMLYLDYDREPGEWIPNRFGGNENLDAVAFIKELNEQFHGLGSGVFTAAEESTAWPMVSRPTYLGGLGFSYKWNMGWMHDTLNYVHTDPVYRRYHHEKLTFGLVYAFSENFMLPLSHDEVVHGKGSLINKMPGDEWRRFANLRAYFGFMFAHPGKKLMFMGGEFAQQREWNHDHSLDWHLLDAPRHRGMQALVKDLNHFYRDSTALHELDCEAAGFSWVDGADVENSVIAFLRWSSDGTGCVLVICNFTPIVRDNYRVGVPFAGYWRERLNTDAGCYGGGDVGSGGGAVAREEASHSQPFSLCLTLPPLATVYLEPRDSAASPDMPQRGEEA